MQEQEQDLSQQKSVILPHSSRDNSLFFLKFFVGHMHMSYFGATGTPVLDFW